MHERGRNSGCFFAATALAVAGHSGPLTSSSREAGKHFSTHVTKNPSFFFLFFLGTPFNIFFLGHERPLQKWVLPRLMAAGGVRLRRPPATSNFLCPSSPSLSPFAPPPLSPTCAQSFLVRLPSSLFGCLLPPSCLVFPFASSCVFSFSPTPTPPTRANPGKMSLQKLHSAPLFRKRLFRALLPLPFLPPPPFSAPKREGGGRGRPGDQRRKGGRRRGISELPQLRLRFNC